MKTFRFYPLALSATLLAPVASRAAFLSFDDTNPNDTISIFANDFENGLLINNSLFQIGTGSPATGVIPEGQGPISFTGSWIDQGQTPVGSFTVYFVEASHPNVISDILQYSTVTGDNFGRIDGTFFSDLEDNLGTLPNQLPPGALVVVEDGKPFHFDQPFLNASVVSDAEVPEASNVLAGLAVAGAMGAACLRRRQVA